MLPDGLDQLDCVIRYRNQLISLHVEHERLRISVAPGSEQPVPVAIRDRSFMLSPGATVTVALHRGAPQASRPDHGDAPP